MSKRLAAAALAATLLTGTALAQAGEASLHAGTLEVPLNKSQVVSADRPIARAMVGNAESWASVGSEVEALEFMARQSVKLKTRGPSIAPVEHSGNYRAPTFKQVRLWIQASGK